MIIFSKPESQKISFGVNVNSPKLKFRRDDFFIRIRGYGKNDEWVSVVKKTAEESTELIRKNASMEEVLKNIAEGIKQANQFVLDIAKRQHTGILRTRREGWNYGSDWSGLNLRTPYGQNGFNKYQIYEEKLDYVMKHPVKNPFKNIGLTQPKKTDKRKFLLHAHEKYINNAFGEIENLYNYLIENFVKKEVQPSQLSDVNKVIAQIRWIMAHATPWERGSDSISNVFMKSLYKAIGIKTSRPVKGISFDMEAYCTNLEEYIKNFPSFFEEKPIIID